MFIFVTLTYLYSTVIDNKITSTCICAVYAQFSEILLCHNWVFYNHMFVSYLRFLNDLDDRVSLKFCTFIVKHMKDFL
jgi:hypothetical protein